MPEQIGAEEMRELARVVQQQIPGLGFCILVFEFDKPGVSNYIANAQRPDMLKALQETLDRLKGGEDFATPEKNHSQT